MALNCYTFPKLYITSISLRDTGCRTLQMKQISDLLFLSRGYYLSSYDRMNLLSSYFFWTWYTDLIFNLDPEGDNLCKSGFLDFPWSSIPVSVVPIMWDIFLYDHQMVTYLYTNAPPATVFWQDLHFQMPTHLRFMFSCRKKREV